MSRRLKLTLFLSLPLAGFFVLLVVLILGLGKDPRLLPSALIDQPLPVFELATLENPERVVTQEDFKGKIALVNVWATWCGPCQLEMPLLVKLAGEGMPIYGVNNDRERRKALAWLQNLGNPYRINVVDETHQLGIDLGVYGLPETFLLDQKGVIRFRYAGALDEQIWQKEFLPRIESIREEQG